MVTFGSSSWYLYTLSSPHVSLNVVGRATGVSPVPGNVTLSYDCRKIVIYIKLRVRTAQLTGIARNNSENMKLFICVH